MKVFPTPLFFFEGHDVDIERRSLSGGTSLSGAEDVVETDGGGRWRAEFATAYLDDPEAALAWEALSALLSGGATPIIVMLTDARGQMMGEAALPIGGFPWWEESDFGTPVSGVAVAADAALRATSITLAVEFMPGPVRSGQRFSIDHTVLRHRPYKVVTAVDNNDGTFDITFRPPLREAVTEDTQAEFINPKCVMRAEGEMRSPRTFGYADGSVTFVEHFAESYA